MALVSVKTTIYGATQEIPDVAQRVVDKLEADGWTVQGWGIGDTSGIFPRSVAAHFNISKPTATKDEAIDAVKSAGGGVVGSFLTSWSDFSADFEDQVLAKSAVDLSVDVGRAGATLEKGATGIGFGIGSTLALIALIVAGVVTLRYLPKSS